jgi:hypothetical protein
VKVVAPAQDKMNCTAVRVVVTRTLLACDLTGWVAEPVECYFGPGRIRGDP